MKIVIDKNTLEKAIYSAVQTVSTTVNNRSKAYVIRREDKVSDVEGLYPYQIEFLEMLRKDFRKRNL